MANLNKLNNLKIATWNVNSLRVRLPQVLDWLVQQKPDVLALQEIKLANKDFPERAFHDIGYQAVYNGQKTYNGVAMISRLPIDQHTIVRPDPDEQHRILSIDIQNGHKNIKIINIYVPNGESPDSPKYSYKLNWLLLLKNYLSEQLKNSPNIILLGDFNIAPCADDVHDPIRWEGKVLFTEPEKQALQDITKLGFDDCFRLFPQPPKSYSWWDYRMLGFRRNAGMRIDHILASHALVPRCIECTIDKAPRHHERPSDHAPVYACFTAC